MGRQRFGVAPHARKTLVLDPALGRYTRFEMVLDQRHLGDGVGQLHQLGRRVAPSQHHVHMRRALAQAGQDGL